MQNKRILITGISGLIGRETINFLKDNEFEIVAISNNSPIADKTIKHIKCSIFDTQSLQSFIASTKPTHLLHLAWKSTGNFNSNEKYDFISSSISMLRAFAENGGKKVVIAGTYVEYGYNNSTLSEFSSTTSPLYIYGQCKHHLHAIAESFCKSNDISLNWGRVFSVYGHETDPRRLTAYVVNNLKHDKEVIIKSGSLVRDYIYSKDAAETFVSLLKSPISGPVNICTSIATSIRDYVLTIGKLLNKEHLVRFVDEKSDQPERVVGDNTRLIKEFGFIPQYSLTEGLKEALIKY